MRLLPDKPSLDFLRKEAKDLLAALRESSPQASLADAQRALASQYGMRDWSELKSEAVRRAAKAPAAGRWPKLELASFAVAVTAWLNWTYNTICEAIDPADGDHAAFAERETADLLQRPMTRSSLRQLLAAINE